MLADALVERYSRQILLPEVGGRGQERLCATRVSVTGRGAAAAFAARLIEAAGLRVVLHERDDATVEAAVEGSGVVRARDGVIATLVGRPCAACIGDVPVAGATDEDATTVQTVGAIVAAEVIRLALGLAGPGRVHHVDVGRGAFASRALERTAGCPACIDSP
jgi:molybdopterin/thiamine biosynthesis adenylyltransferase